MVTSSVWKRYGLRQLTSHAVMSGDMMGTVITPVSEQEGVLEYEGESDDGREHGQGKSYYWMSLHSGQYVNWLTYEGEWRDGCKCGWGKLTRMGQQWAYHDFDSDKYRTVTVAPSWYEGEWRDDLPHGLGQLYIENKLRYDGEFQHGAIKGIGSVYDREGKLRFEGVIDAMRIPPSQTLIKYEHDVNIANDDRDYAALRIPSWLTSNLSRFDSLLVYGDGSYYTVSGKKWFQGRLFRE